MPRRKESWAKRDVLLDQDDFEDFTDLTPYRRMPLGYDGPAGEEDVPWHDPLRNGSLAAHAEGGLGAVALRKPLTPSELKRQQQHRERTGAREARAAAREALEQDKAQLRARLQLKSYLENLEWALPPEALPGLVEVFRQFVSSCPGRTTLPRELAGLVLRAAGVHDPKAYRRFYLEHGRGLWLPRQPTEYLDTFSRLENSEFFGVADAEPSPPRLPRLGPPSPAVPHPRVKSARQQKRDERKLGVLADELTTAKAFVVVDGTYGQARREFAALRALAVGFRFAKVADYLVAFVDHQLPAGLHPRPDALYPSFWQGWQQFLGSVTPLEPEDELREYLPQLTPGGFVEYAFAQEYAKQSGKVSAEEWAAFPTRHPAVPANPAQVYADSGFTTWEAFLGLPARKRRGPASAGHTQPTKNPRG